jgi:hypothetical protein
MASHVDCIFSTQEEMKVFRPTQGPAKVGGTGDLSEKPEDPDHQTAEHRDE